MTHRGIGKSELIPTNDTIKEWSDNDIQYWPFPAEKAAVSWKHTGFYSKSVAQNLFIWLYKFHAEHPNTTEDNYEEPVVSADKWTMTLTMYEPVDEDGDVNSVRITAKVYEVTKNEVVASCPHKVFINFSQTVKGDNRAFYNKAVREITKKLQMFVDPL